jgi:hypothetical protein
MLTDPSLSDPPTPSEDERSPARLRRVLRVLGTENLLTSALHLLVLTTLAVAMPVFDLLGRNAQFFVARRSDGAELVALLVALLVVVPLLVWLPQLVLARLPRARRWLQRATVGALAAVFALPLVNRSVHAGTLACFGIAAVVGVAAAYMYAGSRPWRVVMSMLLPLPLVAGLVFVYGSDVGTVVLRGNTAAAAGVVVARPSTVVFLMFDEFAGTSLLDEHDQIDKVRLPNIADLASHSTWYRNATTVSDDTHRAVPALLSGSHVNKEQPATAQFYPHTLFTLLAGRVGFDIREAITRVCPENLCKTRTVAPRPPLTRRVRSLLSDLAVAYGHTVLPEDLAQDLPSVSEEWGNFSAHGQGSVRAAPPVAVPVAGATRGVAGEYDDLLLDQSERVAAFLPALGRDPGPTLHYLHLLLPHPEWRFLPSGHRYGAADGMPGIGVKERWVDDDFLPQQGLQRHLLQVGYADRVVGQVVARLKAAGRYDDATIVITGDHGASFTPGGVRRNLTLENAGELAPVPLILKLPRQERGEVSDRNVQTIDIVPTLAHSLGVKLPWRVDGIDLLDPAATSPDHKVVHSRSAGRVELPADLGPQRRAVAARNFAAFAHRNGTLDLYAPEPNGGLVGKRTTDLTVDESATSSARLDRLETFSSYDPDAYLTPSHLTGKVTTGTDASADGRPLAVVVNGRIATVTRTYTLRGDHALISAFVPEAALRRGANEVALYEITGPGALRRVTTTRPQRYTLSPDGRTLQAATGRDVPVASVPLQSDVVSHAGAHGLYGVGGYVIDRVHNRVVRQLVLLRDGVSVAIGGTTLDRPDVVAATKVQALLRSGFRFEVPARRDQLRLFAIVGGVATEVPIKP